MTKVEQAELLELGLTEAQREQKAQEISAKLHKEQTPHLAMDKCGNCGNFKLDLKATADDVLLCTDCWRVLFPRKLRSDAGKPKPKKAEAAPGVLTEEQVKMAQQLSADTLAAQLEWVRTLSVQERAAAAFEKAGKAQRDYLDSLKGTA